MAWNDADDLVVGASGQIYTAASGSTLPTTTTGAPAAAFSGVGFTDDDGVTITSTPNVQDFNVWQSRQPARRESLAQEILSSFKAAQWNETNVPLAYGGGTISGSTPNYRYDWPTDTAALAEWAVIIDIADGSESHRFVWTRADVTEPVESVFNRSNLATLAIGLKALAPAGGGSPGYYLTDSAGFAAGS
jgi:hypothetical protein